jgi:hypothetical protein
MYNVKNRSAGRVVYSISETGVRREFMPGEVKLISAEELEQLSFQPGGREIMSLFLQIQSQEAIEKLGLPVEPEYNMTDTQIKDLILTGSLDEFLDCLDFAPIGVLDLLKAYAVSLPITDYEKRKALKTKLHFDVDKAIENMKDDDEVSSGFKPIRRAETRPVTPGRRTSGSSYTITK